MADRIKYKKKYKESIKPLGIGDPLLGAGLAMGGKLSRNARRRKEYQTDRKFQNYLDSGGEAYTGKRRTLRVEEMELKKQRRKQLDRKMGRTPKAKRTN